MTNISFSAFSTASEEQLDFYELHICIRDYCFAREDRLVGVAVLQLKDIVDQVRNNFFKYFYLSYFFKNISYFFSDLALDGFHFSRVFRKTKLAGLFFEFFGSAATMKLLKSLLNWNQRFDRNQHKRNKNV